MLRKLLFSVSQKLPARFIDHEGVPYLERHALGTLFGVRFYLHRFVASDPEGLHDHPFLRSVSLILAGWYWEDRWGKRYKRRWFNVIGPNDFHRVVLPDNGKDVWTIFFHTKRVKPWGFFRPTRPGAHGPVYEYAPASDPADPALSTWPSTAPKARVLRKERLIPCGRSAAAAGWGTKKEAFTGESATVGK